MTVYRADLLSDTLTAPTEGMRAAMAAAPVGDDVFGEDPTVRTLEEEVADLLGHEADLFTPSGSMANQLGLRLHAGPGQELLAPARPHCPGRHRCRGAAGWPRRQRPPGP